MARGLGVHFTPDERGVLRGAELQGHLRLLHRLPGRRRPVGKSGAFDQEGAALSPGSAAGDEGQWADLPIVVLPPTRPPPILPIHPRTQTHTLLPPPLLVGSTPDIRSRVWLSDSSVSEVVSPRSRSFTVVSPLHAELAHLPGRRVETRRAMNNTQSQLPGVPRHKGSSEL